MYFTWDPWRATNEVKSMVWEAQVEEQGVRFRVRARLMRLRQERLERLVGVWDGAEEGGRETEKEMEIEEEDEEESRLKDELGLDGEDVSDEVRMARDEEIMEDSLMKTFPHLHWALPGECFLLSFCPLVISRMSRVGVGADIDLCVCSCVPRRELSAECGLH